MTSSSASPLQSLVDAYDDHSYVVDDYSHLASSCIIAASKSSSYLMVALEPRIVSGTAGSIVSALLTQPFEVAKVKLQQNYQPCATTTSTAYISPISMIRRVIAQDGARGAWAGINATICMSIPNYLLFLSSYDEIVARLRSSSWMMSCAAVSQETATPLIGGTLARVIATTAVAPLELLRTREASSMVARQEPPRVWKELAKIVKTDGLFGLYRGLAPALGRDVPFAALYMLCLERFRDWTRPYCLASQQDNGDWNPRQQVAFEFTNAALAGMVATTFTAPLDIVKTRFQNVQDGKSTSRKGVLHMAQTIVQNEGLKALWRGNEARMLKVAPQYGIMIAFYEAGKKFLG